jgi:hypothetical protein
MFKIQPKPTFTAKVSISVPGEAKPATFDAEFKHLGRDGLRAYFEHLEGKTDVDALAEIVVGWSGVDVPYSADALAEMLDNYPTSALAFFDAFRREALEAKAKN